MPDPKCERDPIEALASEFLDRQRCGECPSVDEYVEAHPNWADEIRELFPTIAAMERLKASKEPPLDRCASLGTAQLQQLGDFRILREIGRGGMGIVYEAEQESLGRRVAVKVLPRQSLLDSKHLERFQREARTAANLHHTNIVPVFGVGHDDGYHYYVMQRIQGVGLDTIFSHLQQVRTNRSSTMSAPTVTEKSFAHPRLPPATEAFGCDQDETVKTDPNRTGGELPAPRSSCDDLPFGPGCWQSIARIGVQVADALQYAHSHGTLHRDIKPANLLLDAQGDVWVTDFGLAKALEHDGASETVGIVGTLRYMGPEQFSGQADARTDVYSLGLTLYELLTLRPAYAESNRSSLIRKITHETPTRPRKIDLNIPPDLETIILKAIAREPANRYGSAAALAEDLQCFLDDKPIHARRVGPIERLWRWSRRNRAMASLTGLAASLLILIVVVTAAALVHTRDANIRIKDALAGESRQRAKAEATSDLASGALGNIFEQFAPGRVTGSMSLALEDSEGNLIEVPTAPVLSKETAALLEQLLAFYERLARQSGDDAELRRKVAEANHRVGYIRRRLGHFEQARAAYLRAIDAYRQLAAQSIEDTTIAVEIARIYNELGSTQWTARSPKEALDFHAKALAILRSSPSTATRTGTTTSPETRYELARTYYFLGRGKPLEVSPGPRRSGGSLSRPVAGRRGPGFASRDQKRDRQDNRRHLLGAIDLLQQLAEECPTTPDYRHLLACCYRDLPPKTDRDWQSIFDATSRAIEILQELADQFPEVPDYRYDLSKTYAKVELEDPLFDAGLYQQAEERLRTAIKISEQLVAEHPNVPDYVASLVHIRYVLSEVFRHTNRPDAAENCLRTALAVQASLAKRFPEASPHKAWTAIVEESLAKLLRNHGRLTEARSLLESSIDTLDELARHEPHATHLQRLLARSYTTLADVLTRMDEEEPAAEASRRAIEHRDLSSNMAGREKNRPNR